MGCICSSSIDKGLSTAHTITTPLNTEKSCSTNNFSNCPNLLNLRKLLNYYNEWLLLQESDSDQKKESNIGIYEYISNNESYSVHILLENYHHLMDIHYDQFEDIYNFFVESSPCNIASCNKLSRNLRQRSDNNININMERNNRSRIYFNSNDHKEVITQQFLDQIHSYVYHQFDTGYKLTKEDMKEIEESQIEESENKYNNNNNIIMTMDHMKKDRQREHMSKIIQQKKRNTREIRNRARNRARNIDGRKRKQSIESESVSEESVDENISNKFQSNIIIDNGKDDEKNNHPMYSFGVRYYYDDEKYKNNKELDIEYNIGYTYEYWFIPKKYKDLKEELLQNTVEFMSIEQYNDLKLKAKYYKKTPHIVKHCKYINVDNLITIQVYCNFDKLQNEYTKTYRHQLNETDEELK
eukprot:283306_1